MGKLTISIGPFSIAMSNYLRVASNRINRHIPFGHTGSVSHSVKSIESDMSHMSHSSSTHLASSSVCTVYELTVVLKRMDA